MKKYIALLFAVVFALALSACADNTQPQYQKPDFTEQEAPQSDYHSDLEGISLHISGVYVHPEKTTIVVNWGNETETSVVYGEEYWIERYENGQWVSCALGEAAFEDIGYQLLPQEYESKEYTLTGMYDISTPGTYRFGAAFSAVTDDPYVRYTASAEFEVLEEK